DGPYVSHDLTPSSIPLGPGTRQTQRQRTNQIRTPRRRAPTSSQPAKEDFPKFGLLRPSYPGEDRLKDVLLLGSLVLVARRHPVVVGEPIEGRLLNEDGMYFLHDLDFEIADV